MHSIGSGHYLPVQSPTADTKIVEKRLLPNRYQGLRKVTQLTLSQKALASGNFAFGGNIHSSRNPCSAVSTIYMYPICSCLTNHKHCVAHIHKQAVKKREGLFPGLRRYTYIYVHVYTYFVCTYNNIYLDVNRALCV